MWSATVVTVDPCVNLSLYDLKLPVKKRRPAGGVSLPSMASANGALTKRRPARACLWTLINGAGRADLSGRRAA